MSVSVAEDLKILQFDIKMAFLNGELKEEVYMKQPEGYDDRTGRVCNLKRSLYGLKQTPRCWNRLFTDFIKKQEMKCISADPCLFIRKRNGKKLIVVIYVDDGLVAGTDEREINLFVKELKRKFKVTIGSFDSFLGMQIKQLKNRSVFVNVLILKRFWKNSGWQSQDQFQRQLKDKLQIRIQRKSCTITYHIDKQLAV